MIAVASMVSLAFVSCAEDDFGNGSEKNNDATVSFEVGYVQDAAQKKMAAAQTVTGVLARAAFSRDCRFSDFRKKTWVVSNCI